MATAKKSIAKKRIAKKRIAKKSTAKKSAAKKVKDSDLLFVSGKHWLAFLGSFVLKLIVLSFSGLLVLYNAVQNQKVEIINGFPVTRQGFYFTGEIMVCIFILVVFLLWTFISFLSIRSIRWELREGGLYIKRGILPWSKRCHYYNYSSIDRFGASSVGFFRWALHYGDLLIKLNDGRGTRVCEGFMSNPNKFNDALRDRF